MRTVLIVDDNVALAENLAEIIEEAGVARACVVSSGEQALELVAPTRFDLLLADMRMPVMNGVELIRRARHVDPLLPIAVMTAFTADAELAEAASEGLLAVLAKPLPIAELLALIARAERSGPAALGEGDVPRTH